MQRRSSESSWSSVALDGSEGEKASEEQHAHLLSSPTASTSVLPSSFDCLRRAIPWVAQLAIYALTLESGQWGSTSRGAGQLVCVGSSLQAL